MNSEDAEQLCMECGNKTFIETSRGLTCTRCGLVRIDIGELSIQEQGIDGQLISTHAVLHVNSTTLIGSTWECNHSKSQKLGQLQSRVLSTSDVKRSRIFHLVTGAVYSIQLPDILISHAMHVFDKLLSISPRGTMLAKPEMQAALSIYIAAKKLKIVLYRDTLLAKFNIAEKLFNKCLMQVKTRALKSSEKTFIEPSMDITTNRVCSVMQDLAGEGNYSGIVKETNKILAKSLNGMREDMRVAVIAFIALKIASPENASLANLARALHCRIASLYNSVTRVLQKIGIDVSTKLSELDIASSMKSIMEQFSNQEGKLNEKTQVA
ncbi:MAG TPA: hypothetical protein VKM55_24190 [Candidatus Lokiarchaeia archaeon]|nr:hypothetical protein [Candidatus Lokiarchaeia archaeon]